jgi:hypothetical protein
VTGLETVDLPGVEILAANVTIHGRGSPPEGDRYTTADLNAIAAANRELADELNPPAKIGHDGQGPAVGHLENLRVVGDKLVADVKAVPRRFAELLRARSFGPRSVELAKITSQRTGKRYPLAVSALAWLGDRLPAVRTLDDVPLLFAGELELVRAYDTQGIGATAAGLLEEAVETGRIPVASVARWERMFAADHDATLSLLSDRQPSTHRRLENARRLMTAAPDLDDALVVSHERELAASLGVRPEELI